MLFRNTVFNPIVAVPKLNLAVSTPLHEKSYLCQIPYQNFPYHELDFSQFHDRDNLSSQPSQGTSILLNHENNGRAQEHFTIYNNHYFP